MSTGFFLHYLFYFTLFYFSLEISVHVKYVLKVNILWQLFLPLNVSILYEMYAFCLNEQTQCTWINMTSQQSHLYPSHQQEINCLKCEHYIQGKSSRTLNGPRNHFICSLHNCHNLLTCAWKHCTQLYHGYKCRTWVVCATWCVSLSFDHKMALWLLEWKRAPCLSSLLMSTTVKGQWTMKWVCELQMCDAVCVRKCAWGNVRVMKCVCVWDAVCVM